MDKKRTAFCCCCRKKQAERKKMFEPPLLLHQRRLLCKCFILKRATSRFEQELHEGLQVQNHKQLESRCFYTVSILMFSFQFIFWSRKFSESYILSQCVFVLSSIDNLKKCKWDSRNDHFHSATENLKFKSRIDGGYANTCVRNT